MKPVLHARKARTGEWWEIKACVTADYQLVPATYDAKSCDAILATTRHHTICDAAEEKEERPILWVTSGDLRPSGGFGDSIAPKWAVYGIPLPVEAIQQFYNAFQALKDPMEVIIAYHGTDAKNHAAICAEGLKETFGMMGHAVYLGSFYKACRYAKFTQDYEPRKQGIVFRCCISTKEFGLLKPIADGSAKPCPCSRCRPVSDRAQAQVADHAALWKQSFDAILVPVEATRYGNSNYVIRNEEYAVKRHCVSIMDARFLDMSSMLDAPYKPLQRDQTILFQLPNDSKD